MEYKNKTFVLVLNLMENEKLSTIFSSNNPLDNTVNTGIRKEIDECWGNNFVSDFISENKEKIGSQYEFDKINKKNNILENIILIDNNNKKEELVHVVEENLKKLKKKIEL